MEFVHGRYLIKYHSNLTDFRIYIFNRLNSKKYGLTDVDTVAKYKDVGIDINECITQCFTESTFELSDKDTYIVLSFSCMSIVKFQLICKNILCESKEASVLELEMKIMDQDKEIVLLKSMIDELKSHSGDYYECCGNKIHEDTEELYFYSKIDGAIVTKYKLDLKPPYVMHSHHNGSSTRYTQVYHFSVVDSYDGTANSVPYDGKNCLKPSPHEIYDTKEGRQKRLIFEPEVDLSHIPPILNLTKLGLFNVKLNITKLPTSLTYLTHLYLHNVTLECAIDMFTTFLASLINLKELSVVGCKFVTDHTITYINGLPKLTQLQCTESGIINISTIRKGIIVT